MRDGSGSEVCPRPGSPRLPRCPETWGANLVSGAFQGSLRRAIHAGTKKSKNDGHGAEQITLEVLSLRLGLFARASLCP